MKLSYTQLRCLRFIRDEWPVTSDELEDAGFRFNVTVWPLIRRELVFEYFYFEPCCHKYVLAEAGRLALGKEEACGR